MTDCTFTGESTKHRSLLDMFIEYKEEVDTAAKSLKARVRVGFKVLVRVELDVD